MVPLAVGVGIFMVVYSLLEQMSPPLTYGPRPGPSGQKNYRRYTNNPGSFNSKGTARIDIPKRRRKPQNTSTRRDATCLICLEDMDDLKTLPCQHTFHQKCIKRWMDEKQQCPICREKVYSNFNL